jgi:hypothetical protein
MQQNSENLAKLSLNILQLQPDGSASKNNDDSSFDNSILDHEILECAMQHDLPIFVSIDGSLDENGVTTTSISIVAPDINDHDDVGSLNWQHRIVKILLICSWRLPKQWDTCINMAELIGFILGEYTIPSDLPIIYITDSNNARVLQRRVKNKEDFTHQKMVRCVKQGIDYSIAKPFGISHVEMA